MATRRGVTASRARMASAKASIPYRGRPQCCRNDTCTPICPIGAKYSPDLTWDPLRQVKRVQLVTRTLVRRLGVDPRTKRITHAVVALLELVERASQQAQSGPVETRPSGLILPR